MITKELLISLIRDCHLYDITDILLCGSKDHFDAINKLYNESLILARTVEPNYYSYWAIGFNILFSFFILSAKYQLELLFTDKDYRLLQMIKQNKTDEEAFLEIAKQMRKIYEYIPQVSIIQVIYSFKNQLYRSDTFYTIYEQKVINYILEQQALGNLNEDIINQIISLI